MSDFLDVNELREELGGDDTFFERDVFNGAFEDMAGEHPADATFER